jgi:hypothetical protein
VSATARATARPHPILLSSRVYARSNAALGIEWHWVGNRPVQPRKAVSELFVGVVADGDDEVVVLENVVERLGVVAVDMESVAVRNGYGPWVDAWAGMCSGRGGWNGAQVVPDGGGELGAGRVRCAHEQHPGSSGEVVGHAAGDGGRPDGRVVQSARAAARLS